MYVPTCMCRSLDYNCFLCLPLASPQLSAAFERWRDGVLAEPGAAEAGAASLGVASW